MKAELKKIKAGAINPRNGVKPTSAELYIDGVKVADLFDEARGGMLNVYPIGIEQRKVVEAFQQELSTRPSGYGSGQMDIDEWFANECDTWEIGKKLARKAKTHIVLYNKQKGEMLSNKKTGNAAQDLTTARRLAMTYTKKMGYEIINEEYKSLS